MDGEPVTGDPSQSDSGYNPETGEYYNAKTFTEVFVAAFPQYLFMGMTSDEFWRQDPSLAKAYRQAFKMRVSQRNWEMWMQGGYIYDAMLKVAPVMAGGGMGGKAKEPGKYPDRPYPLTKKEVEEQEEARRRAALQKMLAMFSAESEVNKRKQEEEQAAQDAQQDDQTVQELGVSANG